MNLYLLRHGKAIEPEDFSGGPDAQRPLTPEGRRELRQMVAALKAMDFSFDLMLSSPYVRARQTAELVAGGLKAKKPLKILEALTPDGSTAEIIRFLEGLSSPPEDVLLVGHEPSLSELISLLISGRSDLSIVMKKGGLCRLSVDSLSHSRCARLEWLLTGKQLGLMA